MNTRPTQRAASLALATLLTLGILGSIDLLAAPPSADSLLAQGGPAEQTIVVHGKRLANS